MADKPEYTICVPIDTVEDLIGEKSYLGLPAYIDRVIVLDNDRKNVIRRVVEALLSGRNVLIVGEPGVGKTTILYVVWKELRGRGIKTCFVPIGASILPDFDGIVFMDDLTGNYEHLISQIPMLRRGVILATARIGELHGVREILRRSLRELDDIFLVVEIQPFRSRDDLRELTLKHLDENGLKLEDGDAVLEAIIEKSGGYPIFIFLLVNEAKNRGLSRITMDYVRTIPKGITKYVETILTRIIRGVPQYHHDRNTQDLSLLLAIYLASKYIIGPMHIDLLRELYIVSYARLAGIKPEKVPESLRIRNPMSDFVKHLVRVGRYLYTFPHRVWSFVIENPSGQILGIDIQRLKSVIPEEEMEDMFVEAYNTAYSHYVRPSKDSTRIEEFMAQRILVARGISAEIKAHRVKVSKPIATQEIPVSIVETEIPLEERAEISYQTIKLSFRADFADIADEILILASRTGKVQIGFPRGRMFMVNMPISGIRLWGDKLAYYYLDKICIVRSEDLEIVMQHRFPSPIRKLLVVWGRLFVLTTENDLYEVCGSKIKRILKQVIDISSVIFQHREYMLVLSARGIEILNDRFMRIGPTISVDGTLPSKTIGAQVIAVYTAEGIEVFSPDGSKIIRMPVEGIARFYVIGDNIVYSEAEKKQITIVNITQRKQITLPISDEVIAVGTLGGKLAVVTQTELVRF